MPHQAKRKFDIDTSSSHCEEKKHKTVKRKRRKEVHESVVPCVTEAVCSKLSDAVSEDFALDCHSPKDYKNSIQKNMFRNSIPKTFKKRLSMKIKNNSKNDQGGSILPHTASTTETDDYLTNSTSKPFFPDYNANSYFPKENESNCSTPKCSSKFSGSKHNSSCKKKKHKSSFSETSQNKITFKNSKRDIVPTATQINAFDYALDSSIPNDASNFLVPKKTRKKLISKKDKLIPPCNNHFKKCAKKNPSATKNIKKRLSTKNDEHKRNALDSSVQKTSKNKVSMCNNTSNFFVPKSVTLSVAAVIGKTLTLGGKNGLPGNFNTKVPKFNSHAKRVPKIPPANAKYGKKSKAISVSNVKTTTSRPSTENITNSIIPRRVAAVKADQKRIALQTVPIKTEKNNSISRGIRSFFEPMSYEVFKKTISKMTSKIKPVIEEVLEQFTKPDFLLGGYVSFTYIQKLQYELEKLFYSLVKVFVKLCNILPRLERRFTYLSKKLNIEIPKIREKKMHVPIIPLFQNPPKRKVNFPIAQRKPRQRKTLPRLDIEAWKFWSFIQTFTGDIVPLIKVRNVVRRDNRSRAITNVQNYEIFKNERNLAKDSNFITVAILETAPEICLASFINIQDLKLVQSAALEAKYQIIPPHDVLIHQSSSKKVSKNPKSEFKNCIKQDEDADLFSKLTYLLSSLKALFDKNNEWIQNFFKWVETEIEKQHVKKLLTSNDKIVAQMCDEVLEILYYERDFTEKQRKMVLEYLKTRRKCLLEFKKFCWNKRHSVLSKENISHKCLSSLCKECLIAKTSRKHKVRYVCL